MKCLCNSSEERHRDEDSYFKRECQYGIGKISIKLRKYAKLLISTGINVQPGHTVAAHEKRTKTRCA